MKRIVLLSIVFFLSACQSNVQQRLVCKQINDYKIPEGEFCDVDFINFGCFCRIFDMNTWEPKGEEYKREIEYCHGVAGYKAAFIAENVRPNVKALDKVKRNFCGKATN